MEERIESGVRILEDFEEVEREIGRIGRQREKEKEAEEGRMEREVED